jgi:hypothetical protein
MTPIPRRTVCSAAAVVALFLSVFARATPVTVTIKDPAGAEGIAKVLVIVRSLQSHGLNGEILRDLSGSDGSVPTVDLQPGLYQAVAMYPYGPWITQARDFAVREKPVAIELRLNGAAVNRVRITDSDLHVHVEDDDGRPVSKAWVIGRDPDATSTYVSKTDERGQATVKIPFGSAEITVIHDETVHVQRIDIDSNATECQQRCVMTTLKKTEKVRRSITVKLH